MALPIVLFSSRDFLTTPEFGKIHCCTKEFNVGMSFVHKNIQQAPELVQSSHQTYLLNLRFRKNPNLTSYLLQFKLQAYSMGPIGPLYPSFRFGLSCRNSVVQYLLQT